MLTMGRVDNVLIVIVVVTALAFDFTNGFHDTANAMATSIASRALRPRLAVLLSAVLNLVGAFLSIKVATTIAEGIVDAGAISPSVVFAGLVGAIVWNLVTWYFGLPSSSSHALIGGVIGATLVASGTDAVHGTGVVSDVVIPAIVAPALAAAVALVATLVAYTAAKRLDARTSEAGGNSEVGTRGFRYGQIVSASLVSLAHGTNDAQKTMGVITLALIAGGSLAEGSGPPLWVIVAAGTAIAVGTYVGGWRVIRTVGTRLTDITAPQGFAAETSSSAVILASSHVGFPLSTTHVCSGAVVGSGMGRRLAEVRWGMAGRMVVAWLVTLPAAALVGGLVTWIAGLVGGATSEIVVGLALAAGAAGLFLASRRDRVGPHNVNALPPRAATPAGASGGGASA
jgi:PiT family inorganic phosphate transporter